MNSNSFNLKGWNVVLVSALFALAAKDSNISFVYLAYFPSFSLWILDAYYLKQERLFRKLYDKIRMEDESKINYSMKTKEFEEIVKSWPETCFSKTIFIFHGIIIFSIVLVMFAFILK